MGLQLYKADLHVHTVLSPCGGLDMSPVNIVKNAAEKGLDMIAITDHNSTRHCRLSEQLGKRLGVTVITGAEVNTREEIHCLTFFENADAGDRFQEFIDRHLVRIANNPAIFGYQFVVDEEENVLYEEENLLVAALDAGIEEVEHIVHEMGGLFVPAHVNRQQNGLYNQLGFLPPMLRPDALEVVPYNGFEAFRQQHRELDAHTMIVSSDAHHLDQLGRRILNLHLQLPTFAELAMAFAGVEGRKTEAI